MKGNPKRLCCVNCFESPSLKDNIGTEGSIENCDFCASRNIMCLKVRDLYDSFTGIIDLYREIDYGIDYLDDDPHDHGDFLFDLIYQDWWSWIFSDKFDEDKKYDFWEELTTTDYFDKDVPERDPDTLYKLDEGPFEYSWYEFLDYLTNKDRLCERSEPRSYPVVGRARHMERNLYICKYLFLNVGRWKPGL
jgi:hypothetical protein